MKIVIVEDHSLFREVIRKVCTNECGHEVVGETDSGKAAVALILDRLPELVILDLSLPDMDGFNVASAVLRRHPSIRFLVLSAYCNEYSVFQTEKLALPGFIDKTRSTVESLRAAIDALRDGHTYYSEEFRLAKHARQRDPDSFTKTLTDRELAILCLIARGLDNKAIGTRMHISRLTAECHRRNIMRKLRVHGTPQLMAFAVRHGIGQTRLLQET